MKQFIIYNTQGKILRTGTCQDKCFDLQASNPGELVLEGAADDLKHKIAGKKVIDKTQPEIEIEKSRQRKTPKEKKYVRINSEQWQDVLARLNKLETKV